MSLSRFLQVVRRSYKNSLERRPILVQSIQTAILMGAGDVIAQTFIEKKDLSNYAWIRTAQFAGIGFFICVSYTNQQFLFVTSLYQLNIYNFKGPGLRFWYGSLNNIYKTGSKTTITLKKVAIDQMIFAPIFLAALLTVIGTLQGNPPGKVITKLQKEYPDILASNYKVWPIVQLINFYVIPLNYQVMFVQTIAIFWNTYVSWKTNLEPVAR